MSPARGDEAKGEGCVFGKNVRECKWFECIENINYICRMSAEQA